MQQATSASAVTLEDGRKAFEELRESAKRNGIQDMSLEEINAEIQAVRQKSEGTMAGKIVDGLAHKQETFEPLARDSVTMEQFGAMLEEGLCQAKAGQGMELREAFAKIEEHIK